MTASQEQEPRIQNFQIPVIDLMFDGHEQVEGPEPEDLQRAYELALPRVEALCHETDEDSYVRKEHGIIATSNTIPYRTARGTELKLALYIKSIESPVSSQPETWKYVGVQFEADDGFRYPQLLLELGDHGLFINSATTIKLDRTKATTVDLKSFFNLIDMFDHKGGGYMTLDEMRDTADHDVLNALSKSEWFLVQHRDRDSAQTWVKQLEAVEVEIPDDIRSSSKPEQMNWLKQQAKDSLVFAYAMFEDQRDAGTLFRLKDSLVVWLAKCRQELGLV